MLVPAPGAVVTAMWPPLASTMVRQMDRPSPTPPAEERVADRVR